MSREKRTYRLILSDILQPLNIHNLLTQLSLPAWASILHAASKIRCILEQLGQRLRRNLLLLIICIHLIIRIITVLVLLLVHLRVRPVRHGVQLLEVSAQTTNIFLAAYYIIGFGVAQLAQSLVARQRDRKVLIVAVVPRRRRTFVFAFFGGGVRIGEISRYRTRSGVKKEELPSNISHTS